MSSDPKIIGIKTYLFENFGQKKRFPKILGDLLRFENPRRGRQARNFTKNVPKILDVKSSSEQIFSEN